jgi:hypothetical protein
MLDMGHYKWNGRVRADGLVAGDGMAWQIQCQNGEVIQKSQNFKGSFGWHTFSYEFTLPDQGCPIQTISLSVTPGLEQPFDASGEIWFDDLIIERIQ